MKYKIYTFLILLSAPVNYLLSQDFLINFTGTGESTDVTSVLVENLTQGKSLEIPGTDVLHLMGVVTGVETITPGEAGKILFYPNPMNDMTRMRFYLPEQDESFITVYDLSGREVLKTNDLLSQGEHTYLIRGIESGSYLVRITSGKYFFTGMLVASGSQSGDAGIYRESSSVLMEKPAPSKGISAETQMQYSAGDVLKLTGVSGNYTTIVTDIPTSSKTITFNFVECTDGDGNDYPVVEGGKGPGKCIQYWMAINLKTTKYNDGSSISLITDNTLWSDLDSEGFCWYNNNEPAYKNTYGGLYNWYTVNTGKLCPAGWHMPDDEEWKALIDHFGGLGYAGGKLKETGTAHWIYPNAGATNQSGFTALPGSYRKEDGTFHTQGDTGVWWTASKNYPVNAWYRSLIYDNDIMIRNYAGIKNGFSVRCVKEK